jgi:multidrug resistance efflux pump
MSKKSLIIPLVVLLVAAGLLFGIAGHLTGWQGNRPDQVTDNAYLRADMTPLSTRISGTVRKVNVNDYQSVKAGQTLIELDDEDYRATLNQAQAALAASDASLANMLGLNVQLGNSLTDSRLLGFQYAFAPHSTGRTAMGRAAEVLGLQVRQQAYTLAISGSFLLLATCCVACLVVVSFMFNKVPTQYGQVTAAPVEAK